MGFWIMGTKHLKARCICRDYDHEIYPGCPIHGQSVIITINEPEFDPVHKPKHYNSHPSGVECIDITRHMTFCAGNAFKYVFRAELKNGKQDFEKALYYWNDVVANQDPIWLPMGLIVAAPLVDAVHKAEPNTRKQRFYESLRPSRARHGIAVIEKLIEAA